VVVKHPLELRDLITGQYSWAAEPRFCVRCASWLPWKCWSAEAAEGAGGLISVLQRCPDFPILLGRVQVLLDDGEAAKEREEMRARILEHVVEFVRACVSFPRRRLGCTSAKLCGGQSEAGGSSSGAASLASTVRWAGGGVIPRGLRNVGGSCGVAVVVQLLRACANARAIIDRECSDTLGSGIWSPLSQLFAAMDAGNSVEQSFTALTQSWKAEGVLPEFGGGIDPAEVLFRLLQLPGVVGDGLQRLVGFETSTQSFCEGCQVPESFVRTEFSFVAIPGSRSLQRQVDKLNLGSRTCACGSGLRQDRSASRTSLGDVFIVQGNCRLNAVPMTLRVRVGTQTTELALVAVFEDRGSHHLLHLRGSAAADGEAEWLTHDDGTVTGVARTSLADGGVFRRGEASRRSSLWVYARLTHGRTHAQNVGLTHPCDSDCGVADCANRVECGKVQIGTCPWLPRQRGLFAKDNLRAGAWVARFVEFRSPTTGSELRPGGLFSMQVRRSQGAGWGLKRAIVPLGEGAAMAANSTCCPRHQNAAIVQDEEGRIWIRLVADVAADGEILVHYGADFFDTGTCVCCLCSGQCNRQADDHATDAHTRRH